MVPEKGGALFWEKVYQHEEEQGIVHSTVEEKNILRVHPCHRPWSITAANDPKKIPTCLYSNLQNFLA